MFWILSLFFPSEKVEKKDYLKILAAAFLGYFVTQLTFLVAIPDVTPMHCSIISSICIIKCFIWITSEVESIPIEFLAASFTSSGIKEMIEGTAIAKKALDKGITEVVFDRGGFIYQGKIQALADAAREAGLQF